MSSKLTVSPAVSIVDYADKRGSFVESTNPLAATSRSHTQAGPGLKSAGRRQAKAGSVCGLALGLGGISAFAAIFTLVVTVVSVATVLSLRSQSTAPASAPSGILADDALVSNNTTAPPLASVTASVRASPAAPLSISAAASATASTAASSTAAVTPTASPMPLPSTVLVASNASDVELWSARMLGWRLAFPVATFVPGVAPPPDLTRGVIAVGYQAAVRYGMDPALLAGLRTDDFRLSSVAARGLHFGTVAVSGSPSPSARGSLYGAFRLLRELGFEFFSVAATAVPPPPYTLPPGGVDVLEQPPLYLRDITSGTVQDNRLRIRGANGSVTFPRVNVSGALGLNGANSNAPVGGFEGASPGMLPGFEMTSYVLLSPTLNGNSAECAGQGYPPEPHAPNTPCPQVVRDHPEWFVCRNSLNTGILYPCNNVTLAGVADRSQPCWSVPSMQEAMAASIRSIMRLRPDTRVVSVDNMDGAPTICPPDAPLNVYENTTGGANFHAVNAIAANLSADFPGLVVQTSGYGGAQAPPQHLRLRDNVQVRYSCVVDQFQSLHAPINAAQLAEARGWIAATRAGGATIWEGSDNSDFTIAPWPNYYTLPQHVVEYAQLGFVEYYTAGVPLLGSDMADLKTYLTAHAMWDPFGVNITALAHKYTDFVYGAAAAPGVRAHLSLMEASFQTNNRLLDYRGITAVRGASRRITPISAVYANRTLIACGHALKTAEAACTSTLHRDNVRQAMLSLQYIVLLRWAQLQRFAADAGIAWPFAAAAADEFALFNTTFTRTKVVSTTNMDAPYIAGFACDLVCLRRVMLGF